MAKFGFIGTGNMGGALARAVCRKVHPEDVILNDYNAAKAEALAGELGCGYGTAEDVVAFSDYIFIGVKPQMLSSLFANFSTLLGNAGHRTVLVSMAAGTSIEKIQTYSGGDYPIIRIMPNVACSVGQGMTLIASNDRVTAEEISAFKDAMSESGLCEEIPEKLIDAGSAISGCGPAYVFMMAEAMADGAVACGVPRDKAYRFAVQTLLGSAELMKNSELSPGQLKDSVCSPGGTTIEGVAALENGKFRGTVMNAVKAAYEKNFKL